MTVSLRSVATFALCWLAACSDAESSATSISVESLSSSKCLKHVVGSSLPNGAGCVISQRAGKMLQLQVFGVQSLCLESELLDEVPWHAAARAESAERVFVSVDWPSDKTPACGQCLYNFNVQVGPYEWPDRTDIKFEVRSCPSCTADDSRSVTLSTKVDERVTQACSDEQIDAGAP